MVTATSSPPSTPRSKRVGLVILAVAVVACLGAFAFPPVREAVQQWLAPAAPEKAPVEKAPRAATLIDDGHGHDGLRLTNIAMANLEIQPVTAEPAVRPRPLPTQFYGRLNYDNERMVQVRPRFQGELVELRQVPEGSPPYGPESKRPLREWDRVKQGDVLAVLWSADLGVAKAALVDAIQNLRYSRDILKRQQELAKDGSISLTALQTTERQVRLDTSALLTAERKLRIWKLSDRDIDDLKKEANTYLDQVKERNAEEEVRRWARVEVKAPEDKNHPEREYIVLEKNTNVGEFVDPGRDMPLFRLGDLSRLQIWVHPPPEYIPLFRERLREGAPAGTLRWQITFQDEPNMPALDLPIAKMAPSLEPNQQTPMLVGFLDNVDRRHIVGQFVNAIIRMPPPEDTVEIPTDAINQYEMQNFVFVQNPERANEFFLRRIVLVNNSGGTSLVRSKLTPEDEELSKHEQAHTPPRRPLEALLPGEKVITKGVVELTSALDELHTNQEAEKLLRGHREGGK